MRGGLFMWPMCEYECNDCKERFKSNGGNCSRCEKCRKAHRRKYDKMYARKVRENKKGKV
jgi:hypothetical protein